MKKTSNIQEDIRVNPLHWGSRSPAQALQIPTAYKNPSLGWVAKAAGIE